LGQHTVPVNVAPIQRINSRARRPASSCFLRFLNSRCSALSYVCHGDESEELEVVQGRPKLLMRTAIEHTRDSCLKDRDLYPKRYVATFCGDGGPEIANLRGWTGCIVCPNSSIGRMTVTGQLRTRGSLLLPIARPRDEPLPRRRSLTDGLIVCRGRPCGTEQICIWIGVATHRR